MVKRGVRGKHRKYTKKSCRKVSRQQLGRFLNRYNFAYAGREGHCLSRDEGSGHYCTKTYKSDFERS